MDQWFVSKKGLAYGIMWAGSWFVGIVLRLVVQWLLESYGFRTILRVWAICLFFLSAPLLHFVKSRVPTPRMDKQYRIYFGLITTSTFGVLTSVYSMARSLEIIQPPGLVLRKP